MKNRTEAPEENVRPPFAEGEIVVNIDVMLAKRKMSVSELADRVGITLPNVSILKNGKAKAIRIETLARLCAVLDCQPGDLLEYREKTPTQREDAP